MIESAEMEAIALAKDLVVTCKALREEIDAYAERLDLLEKRSEITRDVVLEIMRVGIKQ